MINYGLFIYPSTDGYFNIGDYVQSLAAKQYLNSDFLTVNRDFLNEYVGSEIKVIMNGWFTHYPENWPPSSSIKPLFISFHLNKTKEKRFFTDEVIEYLKKHEPIGCRDHTTLELLEARGIKAKYTGCLTLTLQKSYSHSKGKEILLVDPIFNVPSWRETFKTPKAFVRNGIINNHLISGNKRKRVLKKALGNDLFEKGTMIENMIKDDYSEDEKFKLAEQYLTRLSKARLVVTSRIHCALPCLAMGTPVVFIDSFNHVVDLSRFRGITNLFPTISLDELLKIPENEKLNYLEEFSASKSLDPKMEELLQKEVGAFIKE